jgi:hypothetical protein
MSVGLGMGTGQFSAHSKIWLIVHWFCIIIPGAPDEKLQQMTLMIFPIHVVTFIHCTYPQATRRAS